MLAAIAGVFAFAAASGAALEDGNGLLGRRAAWMQGRCGIMVHWLYPSYKDVDRWTDAFDVPAFLEDFEATGDIYEFRLPPQLAGADELWMKYDGFGLGGDECIGGFAFLP